MRRDKTVVRKMLSSAERVQIIGDRAVVNPRVIIETLEMRDGSVEEVELSMETCACGYSFAREGVGYWHPDGWLCKRCGQLHTLREGVKSTDAVDLLTSDPEMVVEFDEEYVLKAGRALMPNEIRKLARS